MTIEQINHLERLVRSRDIELKEVKQKLYNAGAIITKKNEEIEELKKENDAYKLSLMFVEDQLQDAKNNNMSEKAAHAITKQKLKRKGDH